MGLDMYLIRRRKKSSENEDIMYWRKANAIHRWFVQNVQGGVDDQKYYKVKKKQLNELKDKCAYIINNTSYGPSYEDEVTNVDVCKETLPTEDGFFFGRIDYNGYYLSHIKYTYDNLEQILKETNFRDYEIYYGSWW